MKSAYERALERMEEQGIERPKDNALSAEDRERLAEVRRRADAKLAELEIMHQGRLAKLASPPERQEEEAEYRRQRQRIDEDRERQIETIRRR